MFNPVRQGCDRGGASDGKGQEQDYKYYIVYVLYASQMKMKILFDRF